MPTNDSYTSGKLLVAPYHNLWKQNEEGYVSGPDMFDEPHYQLALQYFNEKRFCDPKELAPERDCFYKRNHCHIENRNGARFIRPSMCTKFMLRRGIDIIKEQLQPGNPKQKWLPTYHGTNQANVASILKFGLLASGSTVPGSSHSVPCTNGSVYGNGVYTTMMPLYAQLYAPLDEWNGKFVQTFFMLCQDPDTVSKQGRSGAATCGLMGRNDVYKLYGGHIAESETQFVTTDSSNFVICAVLIKIHDTDPRLPGGEFHEVVKVLEEIDKFQSAGKK